MNLPMLTFFTSQNCGMTFRRTVELSHSEPGSSSRPLEGRPLSQLLLNARRNLKRKAMEDDWTGFRRVRFRYIVSKDLSLQNIRYRKEVECNEPQPAWAASFVFSTSVPGCFT